jgi:hypothetical protein
MCVTEIGVGDRAHRLLLRAGRADSFFSHVVRAEVRYLNWFAERTYQAGINHLLREWSCRRPTLLPPVIPAVSRTRSEGLGA